jgi:guanylate kinase
MSDKKVMVTICGPSTTGKSTLANLFKEQGYKEIVSTTTRPMRTGEIEGESYYFVKDGYFKDLIAHNELVEHDSVGQYFYGVSKEAISKVLDAGNPAVLVITPQGANNVEQYCNENNINLVKVYVNNKMELLIERLVQRYATDVKANDEVYKDRLWNITMIEPKQWTAKAYSGEHFYDHVFDTFVSENQHDVFTTIMQSVEKKLNKGNSHKVRF